MEIGHTTLNSREWEEYAAFMDTIKADFLDETTRKVFSDWLDDHDLPEEADFYRSWTLTKYNEAKEYLTGYAGRLNAHSVYGAYLGPNEEPDPADLIPALDYDGLLAATHEYLEGGYGHHINFDFPDYLYEEKEKFWSSFELVTGRRVPSNKLQHHIFYCSC